LVHPRYPPHRQVDAILSAAAKTLGRSIKLMDAKLDRLYQFSDHLVFTTIHYLLVRKTSQCGRRQAIRSYIVRFS
jgi:hypothetical protein